MIIKKTRAVKMSFLISLVFGGFAKIWLVFGGFVLLIGSMRVCF